MDRDRQRGILTVEASLILMIFIAAYIALLSMMNVYRAYTCIQNAIDQTAKQVSEYAYIAKKLGVHNIGQTASDESGEFTDKTKKMLNTIQVFFNASANGLENATNVTTNILDEGSEQYPEDILSQMDSVGQSAQEIYDAGQAMHTSVSDYFSDEKAIFNGILAVIKDGAYDAVKLAVAMPISRAVTNKYLQGFPNGYLEKLGVQGGKNGRNYWGSSFFLDMQSIEICATYKIRIPLPFIDKFDFTLKNTASTRAWIGDGSFNEPNETGGEAAGAALEDGADEVPGEEDNFDNVTPVVTPSNRLGIPASVWNKNTKERGEEISNYENTVVKRNLDSAEFKDISIYNASEGYIARTHSMDTDLVEYQDGKKFLSAIKKDMKKLKNFSEQGDITPDKYNTKYYYLVVKNKDLSVDQQKAIILATEYARENGMVLKLYTTE